MSTTTYAGPCINGPWSGRTQTAYHSSFTFAYCPPRSFQDGPDDWDSGAVERIAHGTYRWSYAHRGWMFEAAR
jgi:hypothetical protein